MPQTPDPQTRNAVTSRITAYVTAGRPRPGEPEVRYRGRCCHAAAKLPGHRGLSPVLRLRWQGDPGSRAIGIYKASTGQYTESELPGSFGGAAGTPEQGIDETFNLVAGMQEPFFLQNAARWAGALRDAGADVVMTQRAGSHGDAFWREEFPLMVAWAFGR